MENIDDNAKITAFINGSNAINNKKAVYYAKQFNKFNFNGITMFKLSWNWTAFFLSWIHLIYRKIYALGIILGGINLFLVVKFFIEFNNKVVVNRDVLGYSDHNLEIINATTVFYTLGISICCGLLSNFFIYLRYNKEVKRAEKAIPEDLKQIEYLRIIGGKNNAIGSVIGILFGAVYIIVNTYIFFYYGLFMIGIKIYLTIIGM